MSDQNPTVKPKRIVILDKPKRRVEPAELAKALGAKPLDVETETSKDPIMMGELGAQVLHRLRSGGEGPEPSAAQRK